MRQMTLEIQTKPERKRIVNVAQVPQRSPFRYPGGKTWLIPEVRKWLEKYNGMVKFIEPFAGGGIVSLTVAFENLAKKVIMVELDQNVASVWKVIFNGDNRWLANKIINFDLTRDSASRYLSKRSPSLREKAFITILKNRIFHGGILANGSGLLKNGENGKGIRSRWYPETLKTRIENIATIKDKIEFFEGDGFHYLDKFKNDPKAVFFIDPPYTVAGKRLYTHYQIDHEQLFRKVSAISGDFLMTYDDTVEIRNLAMKYKLPFASIPMQNTHLQKKFELIISKDLKWHYEDNFFRPSN